MYEYELTEQKPEQRQFPKRIRDQMETLYHRHITGPSNYRHNIVSPSTSHGKTLVTESDIMAEITRPLQSQPQRIPVGHLAHL